MTMASHQEDIASKLLHSSDARIAEAAKRVFSTSASSSLLPSAAASLAALSSASSTAPLPPHRRLPSSIAGGAFERSAALSSVTGFRPGDTAASGLPFLPPSAAAASDRGTAVADGVNRAAPGDEAGEDGEGCDKKPSSTERLKRSRERNRMHARKTRQRKKEHMQKLQNRADELKLEQIRLKQAINEKNTASILVGLFQTGEGDTEAGGGPAAADPRVEMLLKRATDDIPDASKIPELPALILPGQHNGKRKTDGTDADGMEGAGMASVPEEPQEDGIDYALLGKDRSSCTPAELDQIRRERNRMHAKRTRDRKRIFMEEMEGMIKQLEEENALLRRHADGTGAIASALAEGTGSALSGKAASSLPSAISPELGPLAAPSSLAAAGGGHGDAASDPPHTKGDFLDQIESLLAAAGSFRRGPARCEINAISCAESDVTASTGRSGHDSLCEEDEDDRSSGSRASKRMCTSASPTSVPKSITTTNITL